MHGNGGEHGRATNPTTTDGVAPGVRELECRTGVRELECRTGVQRTEAAWEADKEDDGH